MSQQVRFRFAASCCFCLQLTSTISPWKASAALSASSSARACSRRCESTEGDVDDGFRLFKLFRTANPGRLASRTARFGFGFIVCYIDNLLIDLCFGGSPDVLCRFLGRFVRCPRAPCASAADKGLKKAQETKEKPERAQTVLDGKTFEQVKKVNADFFKACILVLGLLVFKRWRRKLKPIK